MHFFDTHCHLQDRRIKARIVPIIEQAIRAGVRRFLCCGTSEQDWDDVAELAVAYPEIIPAFGLHPWFITHRSTQWLKKLESYLSDFPGASVGEIGLDYYSENPEKCDQKQIFKDQIDLAVQYKRVVSIHCRKAWGDLISIMASKGRFEYGAVLHSFSGSSEIVEQLERLGCFFSFSGSVTNPGYKRVQKACKAVPLSKILIETDSPDCPPYGCNELNQPSTIIMVNDRIAELKGMDKDDCAAQIFKNSLFLFDRDSFGLCNN